jgi:hypothetical protein
MVQDRRAYGIDGSNHPAFYSVGQWFKNWMVQNRPNHEQSRNLHVSSSKRATGFNGALNISFNSYILRTNYSLVNYCILFKPCI